MSPLILLAAAAAIFLWPRNAQPKDPSPFPSTGAASHPNFQGTLAALAMVRLRLLQTEQLDDDRKAAIDALTLALVAGSDKE